MRHDMTKGRPRVEWADDCGQWAVRFHDPRGFDRSFILGVLDRRHWRKARNIAASYLGCRPIEIEVTDGTAS